MRLSRADFQAIKDKTAQKRAKRAIRVSDNMALAGQDPLKQALGASLCPANAPKARKPRKGPSARKLAFLRLKDSCTMFVMLRAKHRTGGVCEVGVVCGGHGPIEVWYHVTPQAMGNALRYDARNILGSCHSCNGGEYFARKRGSPVYGSRHRTILGNDAVDWLKANAGRKQISTKEALEMAREFERRISMREWD